MNVAEDEQNTVVVDEELATEQYLTFIMNNEEYGVDILAVQEIRAWDNATMIPNSPAYIKGVINLRGTIVPIIDLRGRFNVENLEYGAATVVVVLKVKTEKGERTMGIIVDAISDVYDVPLDSIRTSNIGEHQNSSFIKGLVTVKKNMVILLELTTLLTLESQGGI